MKYMNHTKKLFAFACLLVCFVASKSLHAHSSVVKVAGETPYSIEQKVREFLKPVVFSPTGIEDFFANSFNTRLYVRRFMPACFIHLVDFLKNGIERKKPAAYAVIVMTIFEQRMKGCLWVNPYALLIFLEQAPELFHPYVRAGSERSRRQKIEDCLSRELLHAPEEFKRRPQEVISRIARAVDEAMVDETVELKYRIVHFVESAIDRVIWNPKEQVEVWESFKLLARSIEILYERELIPTLEDVNVLLWSLIYRFDYFVTCMGGQLPPAVYEKIRKDLYSTECSFLFVEEQAAHLTSKKEYLLNMIMDNSFTKKLSESLERPIMQSAVGVQGVSL